MLTVQHTQECLSLAFTHAVAGTAGVNISVERIFDYGVDGSFRPITIRGERRVETGFPLDFQLKCTKNWEFVEDHVKYKVENKTYNDLVSRQPEEVGLVLLLLCVPPIQSDWVYFCEENLTLKNCCYYTQVTGQLLPNEASKKTILIPRANVLDASSLNKLLSNERARKIGKVAE